MSRRTEKAHWTIFLGVIIAGFLVMSLLPSFRLTLAWAQTGVAIDLYTNQSPFNGIGANQSADTYEPQELVVLFAKATYNDAPVAGKLAGFQVNGPPNQFQNITVVGSGTTDENGTAEFSFRLPWPSQIPEKAIFGIWTAFATVEIAQQVVVDTLTFRVGYVVSIIEISTLNLQLVPQTSFARQEPIVFNLTVQNIARTAKLATIKVDVQDSTQHPIIDLQLQDLLFQPGNTNVKANSSIPASAELGVANVSAAPFTAPPDQGGRLYSPAINATFMIVTQIHDIAIVNVSVSKNRVTAGDTVEIEVTVKNLATQAESFDLSVYRDSTVIETRHVMDLAPSTQAKLIIVWNTSSVKPGTYRISATAPLSEDPTPSDNEFVNGLVEIVSSIPPSNAHDVAVTNVIPTPTIVRAGQIIIINVTVRNNGLFSESFYVKVYYEHVVIDRVLVENLAPSTETQLVFTWNTSGLLPLKYAISAVAEKVEGETRLDNNTYVDGTVTVLPYPPLFPTLEWLIVWIIILIGGFVAVIFIFLLAWSDRIRRRRRRTTYTVIAHPHI